MTNDSHEKQIRIKIYIYVLKYLIFFYYLKLVCYNLEICFVRKVLYLCMVHKKMSLYDYINAPGRIAMHDIYKNIYKRVNSLLLIRNKVYDFSYGVRNRISRE